MTELKKAGNGKAMKRILSIAAGILIMMTAGMAMVLADVVITGSIDGNTINYSVFGVAPDSEYTVVIEHDETGQSNDYDQTSNGDGEFSGSGTPGNTPIDPGDSVTVSVYDENDKKIAGKSFRKGAESEGTPWYAYTVIGTVYWLLDEL